ncbi:sialic acid-binding Ig-like lectin 13 isoform X1 [Pseudophryne corroboree]|uniref:sialic acid-binding Ig-like lectin 13 isoform X1 n=1 Tax=Pseudophryne corroboree TaxID=495146 RepID=UPI003081CFCA
MHKYSLCLKTSFLLFVLQVCFSGSNKNKWSFTFPEIIPALKHSNVVIPCTYTAPSDHGEVRLIWFKYKLMGYPQIYNDENPSKVAKEYSDRTSLVENGTNSCSLKITDVRETEWYYPGISEDINSYDLNDKQSVKVKVSGCYEDSSCRDWSFTIPYSIDALRGSCVEIPCTFSHPTHAKDYNFFWYLYRRTGLPQIFNNRTPDDIIDEYRGRTFLVGNTSRSCSLIINNVQTKEGYFPGVNIDINSYEINNGKFTRVFITDSPRKPLITGTEDMEEKKTCKLVCSVNHTCASRPPTITWNKVGHEITVRHEELSRGIWRIESEMSYIPSYTEDNTQLECTATFPNNITSVQSVTLNITYGPKNTTISIVGNMETEEGDNVTLRCTSRANPPVTNYTWYKIGDSKILLQERDDTITVQNLTSEKYICSASNAMGTAESQMFQFTNQSGNGNEYLPVIIGSAVGLGVLTLLIIIICVCNRRIKKSSVSKQTGTEKNIKEEILLDNRVYANVSIQQNIPEERSTRSQEYCNNEKEHDPATNQTMEKQNEETDGILYTSVDLPPTNQVLIQPKCTEEETEYSVIQH